MAGHELPRPYPSGWLMMWGMVQSFCVMCQRVDSRLSTERRAIMPIKPTPPRMRAFLWALM